MNFYIDFDHTLYKTNELISDLICFNANYILENGDFESFSMRFKKLFPNLEPINIEKNLSSIIQVLKDNFKRPEETNLKIDYSIFTLSTTFGKLFCCDCEDMKKHIYEILSNGKKYLYDDSVPFLNSLKVNGHKVYILSHERYDLNFQKSKILGSGIFSPQLIDGIILSKISKASLDEQALKNNDITYVSSTNKSIINSIDYKNGIFIDDRPKDLEALFNKCYLDKKEPFKTQIYRIQRPNERYSNIPFSNGLKYSSKINIIYSLDELKNIK